MADDPWKKAWSKNSDNIVLKYRMSNSCNILRSLTFVHMLILVYPEKYSPSIYSLWRWLDPVPAAAWEGVQGNELKQASWIRFQAGSA
jgi:hypothetical protein